MNPNFACPNCGFTGTQMKAEQERRAQVEAVLTERAMYERQGRQDRVAGVNEQLRHLGHEGAPPQKRAERRSRASVAGMGAMRRGGL